MQTTMTVEVPIGLLKNDQGLFVVSVTLPRSYFREPFFIDSLAKSFNIIKSEIRLPKEDELLARPVHYDPSDERIIYTPVKDFISKYLNARDKRKLGFIFHMSRCGSTLMTQMLATSDRFFVLSEPSIINAVLDPLLDITLEDREALLKASIIALIGCSPAVCEWVFIKFRSWNTFFMNLILRVFPDTRWMFIHRHGLEVFPSIIEKPPGWLRSRTSYVEYFSNVLQTDIAVTLTMSQDEYIARLLGAFCRVASSFRSDRSLFVDYNDLKEHFLSNIKKLWDIDLTTNERLGVENVKNIYSKDVDKTIQFKADNEEKRARISKAQSEIINNFVEHERFKLIAGTV